MPDCDLVYVHWEETGGFCRGHIESVNVQYRHGVYCSAETSTGWLPVPYWLPPAPEELASAEKEKKRKRRPTKAENAKHDGDEEEEVKVEKREEQQKGDAQSPRKTCCQPTETSSGGNGKKFQRADCCVY